MKKQIDFILLGTLWTLAVALGASFWINNQFGFNIFSAAHWRYLAGIQASGVNVRTSFYVAIAVSVAVLIMGLYLLMLPRWRGLRLGARIRRRERMQRQNDNLNKNPSPDQMPDASVRISGITPEPEQVPHGPTAAMRPPRLNLGIGHTRPRHTEIPANPSTDTMAHSRIAPPMTSVAKTDENADKIQQIFSDAGYVIKTAPRIAGVQLAAFAIGADEILWMGATNIEPQRLEKSIERIKTVFHDTLDNIEIHVHGFVIGPYATENSDIHVWADISELAEYISAHPAPAIPDEGREDFDAYAEYIETVANYLTKV